MAFEARDNAIAFLRELERPDAMRSKNARDLSYDSFLNHLMELEPIEENGLLIKKPRFFSLSLVVQSRCLHCIMQQHSRISTAILHSFISLMDSYQHKTLWVSYGILYLKRCTGKDKESEIDRKVNGCPSLVYPFTEESKSYKNELVRKLKETQSNSMHSDCKYGERIIGEKNISAPVKSTNYDPFCAPFQTKVDSGPKSEITFIDIDSDEDTAKEECTKRGSNSEMERKSSNPNILSTHLETGKITSDNSNREKFIVITSDSDSDDVSNNCQRNRQKLVRSHKRTISGNIRGKGVDEHICSLKDGEVGPSSGILKRQKIDNCSSNHHKPVTEAEEQKHEERNLQEKKCSAELEFQLSSLRDGLSAETRDEAFAKQFWECFMTLNHTQLSEACEFLKLGSISEGTLLTLCDYLSSLNLSHQVEVAFLKSTLSDKLSSMTDRASHTLMNILYSVIQHEPRSIIEIVITSLEKTNSGEAQCQVLLSLCKNTFPTDSTPFFIHQLSSKNIEVNNHLTSALQVLLNRVSDLDEINLKLLLYALSKSSEILVNSAPFGKLLLTIISKFQAKISNELRKLLVDMINQHKSSLKRMLLKKIGSESK